MIKKVKKSYDFFFLWPSFFYDFFFFMVIIPWSLDSWSPQTWKDAWHIFSLVVHITSVYSWEFHMLFCVWYVVSSLHSIYFTVIQLLLRMIYFNGKRENCTLGPFLSVPTMNCWVFWKQHQVCNGHDMCGTVSLWYKCTFNHCVVWLLIASKYVAWWWINLWDCTNFESITVVKETMVFKWRGWQNDTMLLI